MMKKKLLIVVLLLDCIFLVKGQDSYQTRIPQYEFGVAYGLLTPSELSGVGEDLVTGLSCALLGATGTEGWGSVSADFYHRISSHVSIGVIAGYTSIKQCLYNSILWGLDLYEYRYDKYWFVLPAAKYYYATSFKHFNAYSGLAFGVSRSVRESTYYFPDITLASDKKLRLSYQVTFGGIEYTWKRFGAFFEFGYGYAGMFRVGLRFVK